MMKLKIYSNPLHFVTVSPWPLISSMTIFLMMLGFMKMMCLNMYNLMFFSLFLMFLVVFQWWRDVVRESTFQGLHSLEVLYILRFSFMLFIISELFFFISFFWSFFHMMLSPPMEMGGLWPPLGISTFDPFDIPMLNSFILITSGMTVTLAHHYLMLDYKMKCKNALFLTVFLGGIFTVFQLIEYFSSPFCMIDSSYGSLFFMMTGFHGLHVLIGSIFLFYCYYRLFYDHFLPNHHVGFELACWYWHFVDVVWLFLYIIVYWWCN